MKTLFVVLFVTAALASQAAMIHFDLSPAGTDVAVGLSPSNEVPIVTNSTGSGNAISGGIIFNTTNNALQLAVGYGSAAGFADLSSAAVAMHIHGPASTGQSTNVIISLGSLHFPASDPSKGGVIFGTLDFPAAFVSNLLAGFTYLNIHTVTNPGGEIRGQLIPAVTQNSPPTVSCPDPAVVECGSPAVVTAVVSDPDGDELMVVWTLNGTSVQTNTVPASSPPAITSVSFTGTFPLGTNHVGVMVVDVATNSASCSTTVIVADTTPPVISAVRANPSVLWPPNHKMIEVRVSASVRDTCGDTTWKITRVTSNEPDNGPGDGNTSPDWEITGDHTLKLRAERSGHANGRVYTIAIRARDESGNTSEPRTVTVTVPKSQGGGR